MLFRYALAALVGFSACTDDTASGPDPAPGSATPPGSTAALRQSADLAGAYLKLLRITGDGWKATGGGQELTLTFEADGLDQVRQFELIVQPDPASAFDLDGAVFAPKQPFVTPFASGIELNGANMRFGGASLARAVSGNVTLGTLTLRTASTFSAFTQARLVVTLLSVGPSSSQRERYDGNALRLGVSVN